MYKQSNSELYERPDYDSKGIINKLMRKTFIKYIPAKDHPLKNLFLSIDNPYIWQIKK